MSKTYEQLMQEQARATVTPQQPKTNAENQRAFKARMRKEGYIRIDVWIPKHRKPDLKQFVAKLKSENEQ